MDNNTSQDMVEQLRKHNERIMGDLLKNFQLKRKIAKLEKSIVKTKKDR